MYLSRFGATPPRQGSRTMPWVIAPPPRRSCQVKQLLKVYTEWEASPEVSCIILKGAGGKVGWVRRQGLARRLCSACLLPAAMLSSSSQGCRRHQRREKRMDAFCERSRVCQSRRAAARPCGAPGSPRDARPQTPRPESHWAQAFCAGGDVKTVALWARDGEVNKGAGFFQAEYEVDHLIHTLRKPHVALIDGITFGGGVGVSVHGAFAVATEK